MESSLWAKQKQPVIQGFINEHRKLVSTAASRGFLLAPGFLYEFETGIEIDLKQKLSEVSYKILSEAVERDIKQAGFDADINYRILQWRGSLRSMGFFQPGIGRLWILRRPGD
jgi:hypothetical protein